jgi:hypothetical protein
MQKAMFRMVFCVSMIGMVHAQPTLASVVQPIAMSQLLQDGVVRTQDLTPVLEFIRPSPLANHLQSFIDDTQANVSLEFLYFVPKGTFPRSSPVEVYNSIQDLTTLNQATYFSRDKTQSLFTNVHLFTDASRRTRLNALPPFEGQLPHKQQVHLKLKDDRFGNVNYLGQIDARAEFVSLSLLNESTVRYAIIKLAEAGNLRLSFIEMPLAEGTLYVAHVAAFIANVDDASARVHLPSMFSRRLEGIKGWYFKQVYGVRVEQGVDPEPIQVIG